MVTLADVELVVDARAKLGEGPVWDAAEGVLWWLDIMAGAIHRFDPGTGADTSVGAEQPVTAMVPRASGGFVATVADGYAELDPAAGTVKPFAPITIPDEQPMRMNDGKCDPQGRFWAGTMTFDFTPGAALYRLEADRSVRPILTDVKLSNGLGWSPDGTTMYYIDTMQHGVDAFDFDPATGDISGRRRVIEIDESIGLPDGMCVDAEGCIWVAMFNGSAVRRWAPDGTPDAVIELPVAQVTCPVFGGEDLGDLYITTAAEGIAPDPTPGAGGLFRVRPGVSGLPTNAFAG